VKVTASFGVAEMQEVGAADPSELIAAADGALYMAKHSGRDRVIIQPPAPRGSRTFAAA
jgi:PleD family two-component response regulator